MKKTDTRVTQQSYTGIILPRLLLALIVTFATYHPWGEYSVINWLTTSDASLAVVIFVSMATFIIHAAFLTAAFKALGPIGSLMFCLLAASVAYLAVDQGWLTGGSIPIQITILLTYSVFLGVGAAGAIVWRRWTGQVNTDETANL